MSHCGAPSHTTRCSKNAPRKMACPPSCAKPPSAETRVRVLRFWKIMDSVLPVRGWKGLASGARRRFFRAPAMASRLRCSAPEKENIVSKSRPRSVLASMLIPRDIHRETLKREGLSERNIEPQKTSCTHKTGVYTTLCVRARALFSVPTYDITTTTGNDHCHWQWQLRTVFEKKKTHLGRTW